MSYLSGTDPLLPRGRVEFFSRGSPTLLPRARGANLRIRIYMVGIKGDETFFGLLSSCVVYGICGRGMGNEVGECEVLSSCGNAL